MATPSSGSSITHPFQRMPAQRDACGGTRRYQPHYLCEATEGGLELLQRDGTWRAIHALDGQIIVDAGDMLQNLTNGILKSTTHRVVNPDNNRSRRFSMPYFVHPRGEVDLSHSPRASNAKASKSTQISAPANISCSGCTKWGSIKKRRDRRPVEETWPQPGSLLKSDVCAPLYEQP